MTNTHSAPRKSKPTTDGKHGKPPGSAPPSKSRDKGSKKTHDRHDPADAKLPPYYPDAPETRNDWTRYYDLITAMDYQVADILKALSDDGLAANTVVFFFGDHGRGLPRAKRWIYDSGLRIPLMIRWPGEIKPDTSNNTNPAGGINSNAQDMAKWMIVQLDSGRIDNHRRIFSPESAQELWTFVTPIPIGTSPPELKPLQPNFRGYALGFSLRDYRGFKLVTHTGGLPGYLSQLTMIPELKLGVCVLTNQESGAAFSAVTMFILDRYLKTPAHDWIDAFKTVAARSDSLNALAETASASGRNPDGKSSLPFAHYAGTYRDAWYGDIEITFHDSKLTIRFTRTPDLIGMLEHWHYDTFVARWYDRELRADAFVTFSLNPDGSIASAGMQAVSPATDFSFDFHDLLLKPVTSKE